MKRELLIKEIEILADAKMKSICRTGVIYKTNLKNILTSNELELLSEGQTENIDFSKIELKSYSFTNKMLLNKKKLNKIYIDLKYRGYIYIPF